jgi:hypothetical protein
MSAAEAATALGVSNPNIVSGTAINDSNKLP